MASAHCPSVFTLVASCIREFGTLLHSLPADQNDSHLKIQEDLGRLRVWVGNFGAHRKESDRLSLDHRLREASTLHQEVRSHISGILEAVETAIALFWKSNSPSRMGDILPVSKADGSNSNDSKGADEVDDFDDSDSDSDSDGFWDQLKNEKGQYSSLDECVLNIRHTITSLYKLSLALQNPAKRDRTQQASRIDLSHFEYYDIRHVSDKYRLPSDSLLVQRLGKSNTKRRQLLAYYQSHAQIIARNADVYLEKAMQNPERLMGANATQSKGTKSTATKWTEETNASTIYHNIDAASDSGQTKFSATTSTAGDQAYVLMPPPPPSADDTLQDTLETPVFCPYCRKTIQLKNDTEDWYHHVYSDLRPYICTFGDCLNPDQLYDSYTEWSAHEQQCHRQEWFCKPCKSIYQCEDSFCGHLENVHPGILDELSQDQRRAVIKVSQRAKSSAQQCPLCSKPPISNPSRFQQHLARHLQVLSLFVLPTPECEETEPTKCEGASDESRQVLMVDDESRISESRSQTHYTPALEELSALNGSVSSDQLGEIIDHEEHDSTPVPTLDTANGPKGLDIRQTLLAQAEQTYATELASYGTPFGPELPRMTVFHKLAVLYDYQHRLDEAASMYQQALNDYKETLGPNNLTTINCATCLGELYHKIGKLDEAQHIYEWILDREKEKRILAPEKGLNERVVQTLANIYRDQGRLDAAEQLDTLLLLGD